MKWTQFDPTDFYEGEVLAINNLNDMLVGYLNKSAICEDNYCILTGVTHYIPSIELIELKIQS